MSQWTATVDVVVPFYDLDPMEVVWHGNYVRYFELARTRLLQSIGYDYEQMRASGYAWPVIDLHIRYPRPLRYQQRVRVSAALVEFENRLRIGYEIRDSGDGRRLTHGHTIQIAVKMPEGEMCLVSPPILFEKLGRSAPCAR